MIPFLEGGAWVSQAAICSGSLSTCKAAGSESWPCGSRTSALSFWSSQGLNLNISEKVLGEADAHFVLLPLLASLCTHGFTFEGQFPFALTYLRGHWTDLCQQACGGPGLAVGRSLAVRRPQVSLWWCSAGGWCQTWPGGEGGPLGPAAGTEVAPPPFLPHLHTTSAIYLTLPSNFTHLQR